MENQHFISEYGMSGFEVVGNACADKLADVGAQLAAVPAEDARRVLQLYDLVHSIQRRLLAILLYFVETFSAACF